MAPVKTDAEVTTISDRKLFFSRSELIQRGWSNSAMRIWLAEADDTQPNPIGPQETRSFFRVDRVEAIERSADWLTWRWSSPKKRLEIEIQF